MLIVRRGTSNDRQDFANLIILSAPYFPTVFGDRIAEALKNMFYTQGNLFSWEHTYFAEVDGKVAGMVCGYDWQTKRKEEIRTGLLLFKNLGISILLKIPLLLRLSSTIGSFDKGCYYISNLAVYPKYRKHGIGSNLIEIIEKEAIALGSKKILLDVEKDNYNAIRFYKKKGFKIIRSFNVSLSKRASLRFYRMAKQIA